MWDGGCFSLGGRDVSGKWIPISLIYIYILYIISINIYRIIFVIIYIYV